MGNFNRDNKFGGRGGRGGFGGRGSDRPEMHHAVCSECGNDCEVPFRPTGDKPVFCSDCFRGKSNDDSRDFNRRDRGRDRGGDRGRFQTLDKKMFKAVCDRCKKECEVPFRPTSDKPVFCSECFEKRDTKKGNDQSNKQLEMINNKLERIMKALNIEVIEQKEEVKEVKTEKPKKAVAKDKVVVSEKKESKAKVKKEIAPKKAVKEKVKKVAKPKKVAKKKK